MFDPFEILPLTDRALAELFVHISGAAKDDIGVDRVRPAPPATVIPLVPIVSVFVPTPPELIVTAPVLVKFTPEGRLRGVEREQFGPS